MHLAHTEYLFCDGRCRTRRGLTKSHVIPLFLGFLLRSRRSILCLRFTTMSWAIRPRSPRRRRRGWTRSLGCCWCSWARRSISSSAGGRAGLLNQFDLRRVGEDDFLAALVFDELSGDDHFLADEICQHRETFKITFPEQRGQGVMIIRIEIHNSKRPAPRLVDLSDFALERSVLVRLFMGVIKRVSVKRRLIGSICFGNHVELRGLRGDIRL